MTGGIIDSINQRIQTDFSLDRLLARFEVEIEKHVVKKNNRPIWRNRLGKSKQLLQAEDFLRREFRHQGNLQEITEPFDCPIWLVMHFYFPKEKFYTKESKYTQMSQRVPDLSNMYEIVQDSLQQAGIIKDDRLVESHDLSRRLLGPTNKLEVFVLRY